MTEEQLITARDYLPSAEECRQIVHEVQAALFHLAWIGTSDDNDDDAICNICMVFAFHGMLTGVSENELTIDLEISEGEFVQRKLPWEIIPFL